MATADYELVLMLDPEAPDERRDQIAAEARGRIEASGSLKADRVWGTRKLAYEIQRRNEADYRFFRFESENPLLDELNHNLKITDGVLRFRIFKVDPDAPVIEPPPPVSLAAAPRGPGARRGGPGGRSSREDEAPRPAAAAPDEAAAAPQGAEATPSAPAVEPAADQAAPAAPETEAPAPAEPLAETEPAADAAPPEGPGDDEPAPQE